MDYTVVHYKWRKWEAEAYECAKDVLKGFGFPVSDLSFDDPELVCRGLVIDKERGNFLKIDRHGFVRRAMHGSKRLQEAEIDEFYGRSIVDLREKSRYDFLNTLFSVSEGVLYSQLVQKFDSGSLFTEARDPFDASKCATYADLHRAVSKALGRAHTNQSSRLKEVIAADPEAFTQRDAPKLRATLRDQRSAGKKLALITNAGYAYTDIMMEFVLGDPNWRSFFDVVFVSARKPDFFTTEPRPCYELILNDDYDDDVSDHTFAGGGLDDFDYGERSSIGPTFVSTVATKPQRRRRPHPSTHRPLCRETTLCGEGGVYSGGSARLVEKLFGVSANDVLYVGDHIFYDANAVKASMRWRTMLVVQELEPEILAANGERDHRRKLDALLIRKDELAARLNGLRCHLRRYEDRVHLTDDALVVDEHSASVCRRHMAYLVRAMDHLEDDIAPAVRSEGESFNTYWGFISRAGYDKSSFQRQIEKYADIYTARVTNLLPYTPYHYFRAFQPPLAHDVELDLESPNDHDLLCDDVNERYI